MTDQPNSAALEHALRECLSPEGVATVIAYLRAADMHRPKEPKQLAAVREVEWLADRLTAMLGVEEYNRLLDELAL